MKTTRYQIVYRSGLALDRWTAQLWDKLVAKFPGLILTQGVRSGAAASGGTHLGLGVLDLYLGKWASKWRDVLRYAFDIGFFGWYRPAIAGVWKTHIHLGVRGCVYAAASLKAQFTSWLRGRNGLRGDGKDAFTYRPKSASKSAPYSEAKPPSKPSKPARKVEPWFNVGFLNIHGNNNVAATTVGSRLPAMTETAASGSPAIHGFCEVRSAQLPALRDSMAARGYLFTGYSHMIAVFHRPHVTIRGTSFARYSQQDGGTVEGIYRIGITVDGSKAQVGFTHLDHDSSEAKKRSNLREAYNALRRYGAKPLRTQWKKRTVIIGDFNDTDVAAKVLEPLGFKAIIIAGIDQAWVGSGRVTRGGSKTSTKSDHPRILARLGRY